MWHIPSLIWVIQNPDFRPSCAAANVTVSCAQPPPPRSTMRKLGQKACCNRHNLPDSTSVVNTAPVTCNCYPSNKCCPPCCQNLAPAGPITTSENKGAVLWLIHCGPVHCCPLEINLRAPYNSPRAAQISVLYCNHCFFSHVAKSLPKTAICHDASGVRWPMS